MAIARIEINSTVGSDDDLVLGSTVTLTNADEGGEVTYEWAILSQPSGAAVVLSSTTDEMVTFPITKEGSYLIRLIVNKNLADESTDTVIAAVRELQTGNRIPAAGETTQNNAESGWANTAVDEILQRVTRLTDSGIFVAMAGEALAPGDVVHLTGMVTLASGLPGERKIPYINKASALTLDDVDGPLGIMVGDTTGAKAAVVFEQLCRVMVVGALDAVSMELGGAAGNPVYVNNAGNLSLLNGTIMRQVGDVANVISDGVYDIAISAGSNSIPRGPAGGDLTGSYPQPTVNGIQDKPVAIPLTGGNLAYYDSVDDDIKWGQVDLAFSGSVKGTLPIERGGTGSSLASLTTNGIVYANSTTSMDVLTPGTSGYLLKSNGAGSAPSWLNVVPINTGGTGANLGALNKGGVIYADTTSAMNSTPAGTTGQPLLSAGGLTNPAFGALNLGTATSVTGTLPVNRGGTGQSSALTQGGIVYASTTVAMATTTAGTSGQLLVSGSSGGPSWLAQGNLGQILRSGGSGASPTWGTVPTAAYAQATIPISALMSISSIEYITGTYTNNTTSYTAMAQVTLPCTVGIVTFGITPQENGNIFYNRVTTQSTNTVALVTIQATVTGPAGFTALTFTQQFAMATAHNNNQITGSISFPMWSFLAEVDGSYVVTINAKVGTAGDSFQATNYRLAVTQG